MTPDEWIAQNTLECRPYNARISPAACAANQASSARTCCPCPVAVQGVEPLAKPVKRTRKGPHRQAPHGQSPYMSSFTGRPRIEPEEPELTILRMTPPTTRHHRTPHVWTWGVDHRQLPQMQRVNGHWIHAGQPMPAIA